MLSPFLSVCESFPRSMWFMTCCSTSLNFYLLDLICPSPGVTWNFLPVHWLIAYLSFTLSWVHVMIGRDIMYLLKKLFCCVFFYCLEWFNIWSSLCAPFVWALHRSTKCRLWLLRLLQYWGVGTFSLREKNNTNFVCLEPYLEFEGMSFKVVWEKFFSVFSPH